MPKHSILIDSMTAEALGLLGAQIRTARHRKKWSAANLATRVGVGKRTILAIESGSPSVAVGTVFSAAVVAGVPLFTPDPVELRRLARQAEATLALLPSRVDTVKEPIDDNF